VNISKLPAKRTNSFFYIIFDKEFKNKIKDKLVLKYEIFFFIKRNFHIFVAPYEKRR